MGSQILHVFQKELFDTRKFKDEIDSRGWFWIQQRIGKGIRRANTGYLNCIRFWNWSACVPSPPNPSPSTPNNEMSTNMPSNLEQPETETIEMTFTVGQDPLDELNSTNYQLI